MAQPRGYWSLSALHWRLCVQAARWTFASRRSRRTAASAWRRRDQPRTAKLHIISSQCGAADRHIECQVCGEQDCADARHQRSSSWPVRGDVDEGESPAGHHTRHGPNRLEGAASSPCQRWGRWRRRSRPQWAAAGHRWVTRQHCHWSWLPAVSKLRTRRGRLNIAVVYRPPTSSPKHGISVSQFYREFIELLDEPLALPGELVVYGDCNCPGQAASVDERLLDVLESRDLLQRVDQPTHQDGNMLHLLIDLNASTTSVGGFSRRDYCWTHQRLMLFFSAHVFSAIRFQHQAAST